MCGSRSRLEIVKAFDFTIDRCLLLIFLSLHGREAVIDCVRGVIGEKTFDTWRVNNSVSLLCVWFNLSQVQMQGGGVGGVLAWHSGASLGPGTPKPQRWCLTWISGVKSTMAMTQLKAPVMPEQWKTEEGVVRARERERERCHSYLWKWKGHRRFQASSLQSGALKCGLNVACVISGIKSNLEGQLNCVWNKCWQLQTWSLFHFVFLVFF